MSSRLKHSVALAVSAAVAAAALAGCGGDSEYCAAVKKEVPVLDTFGKKKTDKAYKNYKRATSELAKVAPDSVRKDWTALTKAISNVQDAQKDAKLKLQDVTVESVAGLSTAQSQGLNTAYEKFTDAVAEHGQAVKDDVESECGVKLK